MRVAAGCTAIALTVDTPVLGRRERDFRADFDVPADLRLPYVTGALGNGSPTPGKNGGLFSASVSWRDIEWIADATKLPVLLKGVLTREDTVLAVEHGAAGVIVSNHGGRQLDGVRRRRSTRSVKSPTRPQAVWRCSSTAACAAEQTPSRRSRSERRPSLIGRPAMWGLAADGEAGVRRVLTLLQDEIATTLALLGLHATGRGRPGPRSARSPL